MQKLAESLCREAVRLRVEERASLSVIVERLGISRGAASALLRDYPLSPDEVRERSSRGASVRNESVVSFKNEVVPSKYAALLNGRRLTSDAKGRIAEAAVMFRLALLGYDVRRSVFEGSPVDCLAVKHDRYIRLQVKWAAILKYGRPLIKLVDHKGRKVITSARCDFVVGYNLQADAAYVFPVAYCEGKSSRTCTRESEEAWHLLEETI